MGSSSTVTVGMLNALYGWRESVATPEIFARKAVEIEINELNAPIGIQDQFIASFGGFRFMEFFNDGYVLTSKLELERMHEINQNLMLFFTGITRSANKVLSEQVETMENKAFLRRQLGDIARGAYTQIQGNNIDCIGELLNESWKLKKQLGSKVSQSRSTAGYFAP